MAVRAGAELCAHLWGVILGGLGSCSEVPRVQNQEQQGAQFACKRVSEEEGGKS